MFQVEKRDGTIAEFQMKKITDAIGKAFGAKDMQFSDDMLQMLALRVTADFQSKIKDGKISVEAIQDSVENVLIQCGYAEVAKAYILYRKQREKIRNMKSTIVDYKEIVDSYVKVEMFCLCSDGICRTAHKVDCAAEDLFRRIHQRSVCLDPALGYFSEVAHIQIDIKFLLILQKIADFCLQ